MTLLHTPFELDDAEWDHVVALVRGRPAGSTADADLEAPRASGVKEAICGAVAIRLQLGDVPDDPDEGGAGERIGERIEIRTHLQDGGAAAVYLGVFHGAQDVQPVAVKMIRLPHAQG